MPRCRSRRSSCRAVLRPSSLTEPTGSGRTSLPSPGRSRRCCSRCRSGFGERVTAKRPYPETMTTLSSSAPRRHAGSAASDRLVPSPRNSMRSDDRTTQKVACASPSPSSQSLCSLPPASPIPQSKPHRHPGRRPEPTKRMPHWEEPQYLERGTSSPSCANVDGASRPRRLSATPIPTISKLSASPGVPHASGEAL